MEQSASNLSIPLLNMAGMFTTYGHSKTCPIIGSGRFVASSCTAHEGHHLIMWLKHLRAIKSDKSSGNLTLSKPPSQHPSSRITESDDGDTFTRSTQPCRSMDEVLNGSFSGPLTGKGEDWPLSHIWEPHNGCKVASLRPMHAIPLLHEQGIRRCGYFGYVRMNYCTHYVCVKF